MHISFSKNDIMVHLFSAFILAIGAIQNKHAEKIRTLILGYGKGRLKIDIWNCFVIYTGFVFVHYIFYKIPRNCNTDKSLYALCRNYITITVAQCYVIFMQYVYVGKSNSIKGIKKQWARTWYMIHI